MFLASRAACGLSQNAIQFVVARSPQGVAGGVFFAAVVPLQRSLFDGDARRRAFAGYGIVIGASSAMGPLIGGFLVDGFDESWRAALLLNVPLALVASGLAAVMPGKAVTEGTSAKFDAVGAVLLVAGAVALMPAIMDPGAVSVFDVGLVPSGVCGLILFGLRQRSSRIEALVPRTILSAHSFAGLLFVFSQFASIISALFVVSWYAQEGWGASATTAGLLLLPEAFGVVIGSWASVRLIKRFGSRTFVLGGVLGGVGLLGSSLIVMTIDDPTTAMWLCVLPLAALGLGSGVSFAPAIQAAVETVPPEASGSASAATPVVQRVELRWDWPQ